MRKRKREERFLSAQADASAGANAQEKSRPAPFEMTGGGGGRKGKLETRRRMGTVASDEWPFGSAQGELFEAQGKPFETQGKRVARKKFEGRSRSLPPRSVPQQHPGRKMRSEERRVGKECR